MSEQDETSEKMVPIMAYCPPALAEKIVREATEQRRSYSNQVVVILEQYFREIERTTAA